MQGGWQPPGGGGAGGGYGPPSNVSPQHGVQGMQHVGSPQHPQAYVQPGYGYPPAGANYGSYEFNEIENEVLRKTASRAKAWGIISIVVGVFQFFSSFFFFLAPGLLTNFVTGIVSIIVGGVFLGVGGSLGTVTTSQGDDIRHMMDAMRKMTTAFTIQIVTTILGIVLGIFIAIAGVFLAALLASAH